LDYIETLREQLVAMARGFVQALPSLAIALFVLFVTWLVAKFAVRIADRLTAKTHFRNDLKQLFETLVRLVVWIVGLLIALTVAIPSFTPAGAFAGLGIGAVAIGFAFQDIFENFLAGVLIMLRQKMAIGDIIECESITGRVEKINLRDTHIRQLSNELTVVPNSMLFKNPVKILTDQGLRRYQIVCGVSYDTDLDFAQDVIRKAVSAVDLIDGGKGVEVYAKEFNSSSIDFLVRWWTSAKPRDGHDAMDRVVRSIKRALDAEGIEIPFPSITHTFKENVPLQQAAASNDAA